MAMTPEQFVEAIGTGNIIHNSGDLFGDHLRSVQRVLKEWDEDEELQLAGLFHSIYGTEGFQDFQLSFDRRDDIKKLIGEVNRLARFCSSCCSEPSFGRSLYYKRQDSFQHPRITGLRVNSSPSVQRAEFCAFCNCVMDRTTLDRTLSDSHKAHSICARPDVAGGAHIPLTDFQFKDLITVHLADWLEQVGHQQLLYYHSARDQHGTVVTVQRHEIVMLL